MALEGTLESFSIAEIFQLIATQGKTGILEIETATGAAKVRFVDGQIFDAYPGRDDPNLYIGVMLVRAGLITQNQLEYALQQQKASLRKLGDILMRMGTVSTNDFQQILGLQRREMAYKLLRLKKGKYKFSPVEVAYEPGVDLLMNVDSILMEGSRQIDEWPALLKKIPSDKRIYERAEGVFPVRELTGEETAVYETLDGFLTVRDLVDKCRIGEFATFDAVASLYEEGLIKEVNVQRTQTPSAMKARAAIEAEPSKTADKAAFAVLLLLTVAVLASPFFMGRSGRMPFTQAYKHANAETDELGLRMDTWTRQDFVIPEKVRKAVIKIQLPSSRGR